MNQQRICIPFIIRNKLGFLMRWCGMGSSSLAAALAGDGVDVRRSAPTSTSASPTSLVVRAH
jgi:hypothetical protein